MDFENASIMVVLGFLFLISVFSIIIYSRYRKSEMEWEIIIDDEKQIRRLISKLEKQGKEYNLYYKEHMNQSYVEITKSVFYKVKPKDTTYKKKISENIIRIDYYLPA